uniref:Uncharacterized protein n=1 Tax=Arundo donax TaxID=35708 RepID=A0A0A8YE27_ARUDO
MLPQTVGRISYTLITAYQALLIVNSGKITISHCIVRASLQCTLIAKNGLLCHPQSLVHIPLVKMCTSKGWLKFNSFLIIHQSPVKVPSLHEQASKIRPCNGKVLVYT